MRILNSLVLALVLVSFTLVACAPAGLQTRQTTITQDLTENSVESSVEVEPVAQPSVEPAAAPAAIPMAGTTIHATRDIEVGDTTVHLDDMYTIPAPKSKPWVETDAGKAVLGILGILVGGAIITGGVCGGTDLCNGTITFH